MRDKCWSGPLESGIPRLELGFRDQGYRIRCSGSVRMSLITRLGRGRQIGQNPKTSRTRIAASGICKSSSMPDCFEHFDFAFTAGNEQSAVNTKTKTRKPNPPAKNLQGKGVVWVSDPRFCCHMPHRFGLCRKSNRIIRFQYKDALTHTHTHTHAHAQG